MTAITTAQETPGLLASSIVFTSGSTASINATAEKVFEIITDYSHYGEWNTWTPAFEFDGQPIHVGVNGVLSTKMQGSDKDLKIPLKIIEFSTSPERHVLAWRASYLPSWFAIAERIHVVTPADDGRTCEVRQWESMSGWGAYLLKYLMGVPKQLEEANLKYIRELKVYSESGSH